MIFTFDQHAFYGTFFLVGGVGTMFILVSVHQVLTLLENAELTTALHAELTERQQIQDELEQVNALLEQHVVARTKELLVLNEQLVDNERKLRFDAFHDKLTGLPNRAAFIQHLESALQAFRLDPTYRFGVLFLDFDGFKVVNDSLGHWLGDEFLIALARRLKELLPIGNLAARLGGDEFVVLIENILDEQEVLEIAERIQCELRQPFDLRGYRLYTSASIGIVMNDQHHQTAGDLLRDADIAMYQAKENGKDCCIVFGAAMRAQAMARLKLETALRNALARQELTLAYQPIWNVATQQITGFEALARWHHAEHGLIPPTEFIPIAEETGLIIPLGDWILEEACRQLNAWQTQLPQATALTVSVNISAQQLYQGDLPGMVQQILERTGLSARSLKLEITESIFMEDVEAAIGACTRLQDLGVCLQIDDFGTGYSSFNYLHRLPINTLNIDKSFIDLLNLGGRHVEIVRTIATLAHNLQLTVIAEGVETEAQLTYVEALGCEQVQGYLISKPLTAHAAEGFIQSALVSLAPPPLLFSPPSANHPPSPLHATVTVAH
jgi:diguanylate cyclase (GGDEF)-like protein